MKPILYKVETYIMPGMENLSMINEIDDLKITKQFNITSENIFESNTQNEKDMSLALHNNEEFAKLSTENSTLIGIKLVKGIMNENEILHNECFDNDIIKYYNDENSCQSNERVQKMEFQASIGSRETLYPAKQFSRINSLMSIDERSENSLDTKLNDFCRHGYKNGCTASIPSPEEVSEEIFRENWLQKIEILRNRETILQEKEMNLQKRERELFRKEKELRIAERLFNDKMKQADQHLKYQRDTLVEERLEKAAHILFSDVNKSDIVEEKNLRKDNVPRKEDILKKKEIPKKVDIPREEGISKKEESLWKEEILRREEISRKEISRKEEISKKEEVPKKEEISKKEELPRKVEILRKTEIPKNPQSISNPCERKEEKIIYPMRSNSSSRKSFSSRTRSYATMRYKEQSKINYDDLNSTLSAASVDTPNVRTSVLFDSMLYKKPSAFTRSASERWIKHKDTAGKLQRITEKSEHMIEEEKIFRKVSDNICALQEKETRFQNYGLVDYVADDISGKREHNNEDKVSLYLNLEIGERHKRQDMTSVSKDRPVSWTSEMNEWLQKKRHSSIYSSATKSTENKENVECNMRYNAKKKAKKKFFLFR